MSLNLGIIASQRTSPANLLLDIYPGAAIAYSLRKLRTAYTGAAIRVRRSSDNTETDIGFVENVLDTSTLLTFCGASNGFITIWYDQSGNANNLVQTTSANQPIIVNSGSLITRNGKPYFQASSTQFLNFTTSVLVTTHSYWINYEKDTSGNQAILLKNGSTYIWLDYQLNQIVNQTTITIPSIYNVNTLYLNNTIVNQLSNSIIYRNGISIGTTTTVPASGEAISLPANQFRTAKITLTEFVLYISDQSTNRVNITNNINTYYTIF